MVQTRSTAFAEEVAAAVVDWKSLVVVSERHSAVVVTWRPHRSTEIDSLV